MENRTAPTSSFSANETPAPQPPNAPGAPTSNTTAAPSPQEPIPANQNNVHNGPLKRTVKLVLHFVAAVVVIFLGFMLSGFVAGFVGAFNGLDAQEIARLITSGSPLTTSASPTSMSAAFASAPMYLMFLGVWVVALLWMLPRFNRPVLLTLGTSTRGNTAPKLLLGIGIGFVMNGACIAIACLSGQFSLDFLGVNIAGLAILFVSVFLQSAAEEFICRCYLYQQTLRAGTRPIVAILICAAFFATLHLGNHGITLLAVINIFLVGIFFGLLVLRFNSPWAAMGAHAGWNFTQNIIFGLPNSGNVVPFSVFGIAGSAQGGFAYDPIFGVEGSALASVVLLVGIVALLAYNRRKSAPPSAWELAAARAAR